MRSNHCLAGKLLLSILVLATTPLAAPASNNRSKCRNNMTQVGLALLSYHQVHGVLTTDICDHNGRPILSWRVRLLPYVEDDYLFKQFRLNEPWDSEHNRKLIEKTPSVYCCPSIPWGHGLTTYVRLVGAEKVLLAEVDDEHAIVWSKPGDLMYDPERPAAGLTQRHPTDSLARGGGFVLFADGKTRLVPAGANPDMLRAYFSAGGNDDEVPDLPWHRALFVEPIRYVMWPWLCLTAIGAVGALRCAVRLLRWLPVSPGEMLWMIAGVIQATHFGVVLARYRYELIATLGPDQCYWFWFMPSLAGTLATIVPIMMYFSLSAWWRYFVMALALFSIRSLDAGIPHQHRSPDESFVTASAPLLLAFLAVVAALMTLAGKEPAAWTGRRLAHWTGIIVCLLPFVFYEICVAYGVAYPRELFGRIRD